MTLAQLQYFKTLAHVLHYTRAAEQLHIAQPSLSYSISELEKELGVKLFEKEDRKIRLTSYGEQFLPYVENALAVLAEGSEMLHQMAGTSYQVVRLGYFHSIAASLIPEMMNGIYQVKENERLRFQFTEAVSLSLFNQLKNGDLDLAFCMHADDTVESVPVLRQPLYLVVPPDHPLAARETVQFEDFAREPFTMLDKSNSLRSYIDKMYTHYNVSPNIMFSVRECNAAVQYVSLRLCVTILTMIPAMESDKVCAVPIEYNGAPLMREVYFSWSKQRPLSSAAKRVRDYITGHYALTEKDTTGFNGASAKA